MIYLATIDSLDSDHFELKYPLFVEITKRGQEYTYFNVFWKTGGISFDGNTIDDALNKLKTQLCLAYDDYESILTDDSLWLYIREYIRRKVK